ncbi:MAG: F0F1 ATP synthase subunit delta [Patescibacteria group bacterium]
MSKDFKVLADKIVKDTADYAAADLKVYLEGVVEHLASRGQLLEWRQLEKELHAAWKRKHGAAKLTVASAHPLTETALKHLEALAPGAEFVQVVDERLMAGAIVRLDDYRLDGTVLGALTRLKQQLRYGK